MSKIKLTIGDELLNELKDYIDKMIEEKLAEKKEASDFLTFKDDEHVQRLFFKDKCRDESYIAVNKHQDHISFAATNDSIMLTRKQMKEILPYLQKFIETGELF